MLKIQNGANDGNTIWDKCRKYWRTTAGRPTINLNPAHPPYMWSASVSGFCPILYFKHLSHIVFPAFAPYCISNCFLILYLIRSFYRLPCRKVFGIYWTPTQDAFKYPYHGCRRRPFCIHMLRYCTFLIISQHISYVSLKFPREPGYT